MPLPERVIQPVNVSRGTLQVDVPDVLEGVTNGTLANIIRQLSSLSRHAEEMFGNLFKEAEGVAARSSNLQARIDRLAIRVTQLDSTVEEVSLQDIQLRKAYKSSQTFDQQVVSRETMPKAMLEAYMACDKPPPLDKLNPYREDGKDGLKFYTDSTYFFELWRQEMLKDTERMMHDRGKKPGKSGQGSGQKADGGRHKRKVRQPHNTAERQKQKALGRGEYFVEDGNGGDPYGGMDPGYAMENGGAAAMMNRPNSIDVKSAAYYQQLQLQQQQQQQAYNRQNGGYPQNPATQESIYMPRVLRNHDEGTYNTSPRQNNYQQQPPAQMAHNLQQQIQQQQQQQQQAYPPHARFNNFDQNQQQQQDSFVTNTNVKYQQPPESPSKMGSPTRPSQPPPAPPPGTSPAGTPTRDGRGGSAQRESLPPPPPPPPTSEPGAAPMAMNGLMSNISQPIMQTTHTDMELPPPPPQPDGSNSLGVRIPPEHLPPSPPPPPAPVTTTAPSSSTGAPPPPAPPPPPPPPTAQMNGLSITNGDLAKNLKNENKSSSPVKTDGSPPKNILSPQQKKPAQPAHLKAQDGVRSDLLKAIRDGIALKKVEQREQAKSEEANGQSSTTDVASILARRVAVEMSDSDDAGGPSDSEYDSDDWGDESTA